MMNANTTAAIAAIQEILATVTTTATTAITAINEILATVTTTETATTETTTTTEAATTETATTPEEKAIVVLDDDDNVIAVGGTVTTGALPCPPDDVAETAIAAETAEAAATDATPAETATTTATETTTTETTTAATETTDVVETTINGVTTARKAVVATEDDLENIYEITKYILRHEGVNCGTDTSIYAPTKNVHVSFNNNRYKIYLSIHDSELVVMLMKCNCNEEVIMKMKATISSIEIVTVDEEIEVLASNARINTVINLMSSAIDLIK